MPKFSKPRAQRSEPCFLEWLMEVLDRQRSVKNAYWIDKKAMIFAVRWVHRKSTLWTEECAELFKLWKHECRRSWRNHSDDFQKNLKTNFRMNLRSKYFLELTKWYKDKNFEFPVRVFMVNKTGEGGSREKPSRPNCENTKSFGEKSLWSNNPTGAIPRTNSTFDWKEISPPYKLSSWDRTLGYSNAFPQDYLNEYHPQTNELNSFILEAESCNDDFKEIDVVYPFMDEKTIAEYFSELETASFFQENSFVSSPTDSGYMERSSTTSFSSAWSEGGTSQNLDEVVLSCSFDTDFSDPVFL